MNVPSSTKMDREGVAFASLKFEKIGFIFREQSIVDIGVDAHLEVQNGSTGTGKLVGLQIKSGMSYFTEETHSSFMYRGDQEHLDYWINHSLPILIVLYHPEKEELYWEIVSNRKMESTGKGWKLPIPKQQKVNIGMQRDILNLVSKLPAFSDYTIISTEYYSVKDIETFHISVMLNKEHTQLEIIDMCTDILVKGIKSPLCRIDSPISYKLKDKSLHIVKLLVYLSNDDEINNNFIACSLWASSQLTDEDLLISKGEDIGNDITLIWNDGYHWKAGMNMENTASKTDYLNQTDSAVSDIDAKVIVAESIIKDFEAKLITKSEFLTAITEISSSLDADIDYFMGFDFPPFECKGLAEQFRYIVTRANEFLELFGNWTSNNDKSFDLGLYRGLLEDYKERVSMYAFERKKIQDY